MTITPLRASSFEEAQIELAAAEMLTTHEISGEYSRFIEREMLSRLRTLPASEWSADERRAALRVANLTRPWHYVGILGTLGLRWYSASLPTVELGEVLVIDIPEFTDLVPTRRLADLVRALDSGKRTSDDKFSAKYRLMRPTFDAARMKGLPMVVSERSEGPYVEFEGLTRMCCLQSLWEAHQEGPALLSVLIGVGEGVHSWQPFYGRLRG